VTDWGRDTPWRQGSLLTADAIKALIPKAPEGACAIVVSHDCDIVNSVDREPNIEVLIGKVSGTLDGNKTFAKNARVLQLKYTGGEASCIVEIPATAKTAIPKNNLVAFGPDTKNTLGGSDLRVLQRWLASRYHRSAFPDAFDAYLDKSKLKEGIVKILRAHGAGIRGIFFDLDHGDERAHETPNDPYVLGIILLVDSDEGEAAFEEAEKAKKQLEVAFEAKFYAETSGWQNIKLEYCEVISDEVMSIHQASQTKEWKLEYISLEKDPHETTLIS